MTDTRICRRDDCRGNGKRCRNSNGVADTLKCCKGVCDASSMKCKGVNTSAARSVGADLKRSGASSL